MAKAVKKVVKEIKSLKSVKNLLPKFDMKMSNDQMEKRVDSLKADMSQAINLSTATSILALLLFIGAPSVFPEIINPYLPSSLKIMQGIVIVPSVLWVLTLLSNLVRFVLIVKLQKKLSSK
jgi:Na+-transporting NADH:ubiquinone oxidoreductase subunit NqrD